MRVHFAYLETWASEFGPQVYYSVPLCGTRKRRVGVLRLTNRHADVTCTRCVASLVARG